MPTGAPREVFAYRQDHQVDESRQRGKDRQPHDDVDETVCEHPEHSLDLPNPRLPICSCLAGPVHKVPGGQLSGREEPAARYKGFIKAAQRRRRLAGERAACQPSGTESLKPTPGSVMM
jgi:hypothetical protein